MVAMRQTDGTETLECYREDAWRVIVALVATGYRVVSCWQQSPETIVYQFTEA